MWDEARNFHCWAGRGLFSPKPKPKTMTRDWSPRFPSSLLLVSAHMALRACWLSPSGFAVDSLIPLSPAAHVLAPACVFFQALVNQPKLLVLFFWLWTLSAWEFATSTCFISSALMLFEAPIHTMEQFASCLNVQCKKKVVEFLDHWKLWQLLLKNNIIWAPASFSAGWLSGRKSFMPAAERRDVVKMECGFLRAWSRWGDGARFLPQAWASQGIAQALVQQILWRMFLSPCCSLGADT